jgi:hypothetical protein
MATIQSTDARRIPGEPYEFSPPQNEVIDSLGSSMKWVAIPCFALGMMTLFYLIMGTVWAVKTGAYRDWHAIAFFIFLLASCILYLALGRWTLTASVGFRGIVETRGHDMDFLMMSLDNLRKMYGVLALFVKAFLIISLIGLVLSVIGVFRSDQWGEFRVPPAPGAPAAR